MTTEAIEHFVNQIRKLSESSIAEDENTEGAYAPDDLKKTVGSVDNCSPSRARTTFRGLSAESMGPADKPRNVEGGMTCQQTLLKLIEDMPKLDSDAILNLFQTQRVLPRYDGLIHLFKEGLDDTTALLLLDLVGKFSDNQLLRVFSSDKTDCLLRYFHPFSLKVISKGLSLLDRFSNKDIETLLSIRDKSDPNSNTALDLPFFMEQADAFGDEVAIAYVALLKKTSLLREILHHSPRPGVEPFLHRLVKHHYIPALKYYLQQPDLQTTHRDALGKTASELAEAFNRREMLSLFGSKAAWLALDNPQQLEDILKKNPDCVHTQWDKQLSLVHCAVTQNKPQALRQLLDHKANPNAQDAEGLTPLDLAFKQQNKDCIQILIQHPNILLTRANAQGVVPLVLIIQMGDFALFASAVHRLSQLANADKLPSFIQAFSQIQEFKETDFVMGRVLFSVNTTEPGHMTLTEYCMQSQDSRSLFLMHAGACLNATSVELLNKAGLFVTAHLNTLENKEASPMDKERAGNQLKVFLFSIEASFLVHFLKSLDLKPEQSLQLDVLLCQGLVQPLFFSRLSLEEHLSIEQCLSNLRKSLPSIARVHFRHTDLGLLPPALLFHYADILSKDSLYQLGSNRFNAALLILTLTKELQTPPKNKIKIHQLFNKLEKKLTLFNARISQETSRELGLMLNLARLFDIKQAIKTFLQKAGLEQSLLHQNCHQLFCAFDSSQNLFEDGLLRELFMDFGNNAPIAQNPENHLAFSQLILYAKPHEVVSMIEKQLHQPEGNLEARAAFNQIIIQGILAHQDLTKLLAPLFQWAITKGFAHQLTEHIPQLVQISADWDPVHELLTESLRQHNQMQVPFMDLQVLCLEQSIEAEALVNCIDSWSEEQLDQLIHISEQAQALDLHPLFNSALCAKTIQLPAGFNLSRYLAAISKHRAQVLSLKALMDGLYFPGCDVSSRLMQFSTLIQTEQGHLTLPAIQCWINSYLPVLKFGLGSIDNCPPSHARTAFRGLPAESMDPADTPREVEGGMTCQQTLLSESQAFMNALVLLLSHSSHGLQVDIIQTMSAELLEILLNQSVSGLHSEDAGRAHACSALLTYLAHCNFCDNETNIQLIKSHLGQSDVSILKEATLIQLAKSILKTDLHNLDEATFNGIWITRLLVRPDFIALCSPTTLFQLIEHYRLISLTLKQDEYESLCRFINQEVSFEDKGEHMVRWRSELLQDPIRKAFFLEKQLPLLNFRADHAIRELLLQLTTTIDAAEPNIAEKARETLCGYYNQQLFQQGTHFLFQKITNFLYNWTRQGLGDIPWSQKKLYQWINHYLPHQNFEQRELAQKNQNKLYNESGKLIGYINEVQCAMTADNQLLIKMPSMKPGMELYDEQTQTIGLLTATGVVERINLFQKNTSALLIATVPMDQLVQSGSTLNLLLHDVLQEQSIDVLYDCETLESDPKKRAWIQSQLNSQFAASKQIIPNQSIQQILDHHENEAVSLLAQTQLPANAKTLFQEILAHDSKRQALFQSSSPDFALFLKRVGPRTMLASFLEQHHDKTWYAEGLALFAHHLKALGQSHALTQAILILDSKLEKKITSKTTYDAVMLRFLSTESMAKLVLQGFLLDGGANIQESQSEAIQHFSSLFRKSQLLPCIQALNAQETNWRLSQRYRLLLMIFAVQQNELFPEEELRYSTEAWSSHELMQIATFVFLHLKNKHNPDNNLEIGGKLLSELVFHAANFGQTSFFYNKKNELDPQIAGFTLEKSLFNRLAAQFYLPEAIKKTMRTPIAALHRWFDSKQAKMMELKHYLKENQAIIDWKKMARDSWSHADGGHLSLFCAFLINYIGPKQPVEHLLNQFINSPELHKDRKHIHALSRLLTQIPHRDVSVLIFSSLAANPKVIDAIVMQDMAYFYQKMHSKSDQNQDPIHSSLDLIRYFGQQKNYAATIQCCTLLKAQLPQGQFKQQIQKAHQEARLEYQLSFSLKSWYFKFLSFIKRLWNYDKKPSSFVCFCDETIVHPKLVVPEEIGIKHLGGQHIELQKQSLVNSAKLKAYRDKLRSVDSGYKTPTPSHFGRLFTESMDPVDRAQELGGGMTDQQPLAKIIASGKM